jgi:hypothetical protein
MNTLTCTTTTHAPLKADPHWKTLRFLGIQVVEGCSDDESAIHLELRDCPYCGSTLARPLDTSPPGDCQ